MITRAVIHPLTSPAPTPDPAPTHTIWRLATNAEGWPTLRPTCWIGSQREMYEVLRSAPEGGYYLTQNDVDDSPGASDEALDYALDEMTGEGVRWAECGQRSVQVVDWVCRFMDLPDCEQVSEILILVEVES